MAKFITRLTKPEQAKRLAELRINARAAESPLIVVNKFKVVTNQVNETLHQGRVYNVWPLVMLQEMVVHGTGAAYEPGPAFIPKDALEETDFLWNGVPALFNHPDFGLGIDEWEINDNGLGQIFNSWVDRKGKLNAELWIDMEAAARHERWEDIKLQLDSGTLEVSTSYLVTNQELKEGTFKGDPYNQIHRGLIPLHLALLPDTIGACSVTDGCGVSNSTNKSEDAHNKKESKMNKLLIAALVSYGFTEEQIGKLISSECDMVQEVATTLFTDVKNQAGKVATLQSENQLLKADNTKLLEASNKIEAEERTGYLKTLELSDDDEAVKDTPTAMLKQFAGNAKKKVALPEGANDQKKSADNAGVSEDAKPVKPQAANSAPIGRGK